jgi:hypothetical protein
VSKAASPEYKLGVVTRCTLRDVPARRWAPAIGVAVAAVSFAIGAQAQDAGVGAPDAARAPVVNAVWVEREFSFAYMGIGTYYSCGGLRNKIEYVLEQLGARPEPRVSVSCLDGPGPERLPMARIRVAMPAEATPELLAQLEEERSRRELVGRVQNKGAAVDDATAQFAAERRTVEFDGRRGKRIEDGDCELLDQLLPQVLEPMGVRELPGSSLACVPKQSQFGAVNLKLESLHALPAAVARASN